MPGFSYSSAFLDEKATCLNCKYVCSTCTLSLSLPILDQPVTLEC